MLAGIRPDGKAAVIRQLRENGQPAVFVGDGVNDAAALAQADLGMAVGTGTDAAIGAADLTLVGASPGGIADAIELARATMTVIRANLGWAFCYNLIALPLAALGYLNPLFAGIAMSASSLIVVANSLRLRRFTPGRRQRPGRAGRAGGGLGSRRRPAGGTPAAGVRRRAVAPGWPAELVRAAAGPVICAIVLIGLLAGWAAVHGAGTLTRVQIQVTLATVPMRAFTPQAADAIGTAQAYLVIRNLSAAPDELIAVRTPIASRVIFVRGRPRRPADPGRGPDRPGRGNPLAQPAHRRPAHRAPGTVREQADRAAHPGLPPRGPDNGRRDGHRSLHPLAAARLSGERGFPAGQQRERPLGARRDHVVAAAQHEDELVDAVVHRVGDRGVLQLRAGGVHRRPGGDEVGDRPLQRDEVQPGQAAVGGVEVAAQDERLAAAAGRGRGLGVPDHPVAGDRLPEQVRSLSASVVNLLTCSG